MRVRVMERKKREGRELRMTSEQRGLAAELARRAHELRSGSEEGLSVTEAVELAAIQLGLAQEGLYCPSEGLEP